MKALVIGAAPVDGSADLVAELAAHADLVVSADAAGEWCMGLGITPHIAVGDFDSSQPGAAERLTAAGVDVRRYPADKDHSDLDLAVAAAREAGATQIVLTACTSRRLDHTLGAIGTAMPVAGLDIRIVEPHLSAWVLDSATRPCVRLTLPKGTLVSVLALGPADGVSLSGLRYPLDRDHLSALSSRGLSNASVADVVTVRVESGRLLVIASRDH